MLETLAEVVGDVVTWLGHLGDLVLELAATPWSLLLMLVFTIINGRRNAKKRAAQQEERQTKMVAGARVIVGASTTSA